MTIDIKGIPLKIFNFFRKGKLNNGEPVKTAIKKIIVQLLIIILIPVFIIGIMYIGVEIRDRSSDDGYLTVSMSSKYRTPVRTSIKPLDEKAICSGYAATEIISKWLNDPITQKEIEKSEQGEHKEDYFTSINYLFDTYLDDCDIEQKSGITNFELLSEMYNHIKADGAVAVSIIIEDKKTETSHIGIGFVTSINYTDDAITVYLESGVAEVYTTDEFIAATRFTDYSTSLKEKVFFAIGLYSINNAWFISEK